jgi:predicted nucleotidyltransferase
MCDSGDNRGTTVELPDGEEYRDPAGWSLAELRRLARVALAGRPIRVTLFGSRARGDARRFADIDVALDAGDVPVPMEVMVALREAVEQSRIPYRVDLRDAGAELRAAVAEEGQIWIG